MSRMGLRFTDCTEWVYWCTCARGHLINSCSSLVDCTFEEFTTFTKSECIHIQATKEIVAGLDSVNDISVEQDFSGK